MSYRVELERPAERELDRLPGYVRAQALDLLEQARTEPRLPRAKELRDKPGIFRVWLAGR